MQNMGEIAQFLQEKVNLYAKSPETQYLALFPSSYIQMSLVSQAALNQGIFRDPLWLSDFAVLFDRQFVDALQYPEKAPLSWRRYFEASPALRKRTAALLLVASNAHIGYDLAVTTSMLVPPGQEEERYADFQVINQIINDNTDRVEDNLVGKTKIFEAFDFLLGRAEEKFVSALYTKWRNQAWRDGLDLRDKRLSKEELDKRINARGLLWSAVPI